MSNTQPSSLLTQKTNRNLFWSGGSFILTAILNFGILYLLTLYLQPNEMALVFIGVIFQDLALLFMDSGMGSYVIQATNLTQREYSSLFYQALLLGSGLTLLLSLLAPLLAIFFHSPPLQSALQITALSFIPIALSFPQKQRLQRALHFKQIAWAEFMGMLLASGTTIWMAINGQGAASYLYGFMMRKLGEAVILWFKEPWFPQPVLIREQVYQLFRYSFFASNALILSYATRLVDTLVVGRVLGTHILGLYSLASNLVFFPVSKCVLSFSRVFIVNFSHSKHDLNVLKATYLDSVSKLAALLLPALAALAILIPNILHVFFKPQWLPMAPLVQIMTLQGLIITFLRIGEPMLLALAKVRTVFIIYTINIVLTAALLFVMIQYGAVGAAWATLLAGLFPCWLMYRALNSLNILSFKTLLQRIQGVLWLTVVTILALSLLQVLPGMSDLSILLAALILMPLVYILIWKRLTEPKKAE